MRTAAILLNYKRPQNLPRIVTACLQSGHRPDVYVLDNSPDDSLGATLQALGAALPEAQGRIHYRAHRANRGSGERHTVAASLDYDAFVSIDDDTFLTSAQIDALFAAYQADASCIHGIWGERITVRHGQLFLANAVHGYETRVRILNRVYTFGPQEARMACEILRELGHSDWVTLGPGSDIVLSFSARNSPLVHDVGPIESCPTMNAAGIAIWRNDNFIKRREALLLRLLAMRRGWVRAGRFASADVDAADGIEP